MSTNPTNGFAHLPWLQTGRPLSFPWCNPSCPTADTAAATSLLRQGSHKRCPTGTRLLQPGGMVTHRHGCTAQQKRGPGAPDTTTVGDDLTVTVSRPAYRRVKVVTLNSVVGLWANFKRSSQVKTNPADHSSNFLNEGVCNMPTQCIQNSKNNDHVCWVSQCQRCTAAVFGQT